MEKSYKMQQKIVWGRVIPIVSKQSADLLQKMPMLLNLTVLFIAIHKMQLYKETTGVSVFKPSADKL